MEKILISMEKQRRDIAELKRMMAYKLSHGTGSVKFIIVLKHILSMSIKYDVVYVKFIFPVSVCLSVCLSFCPDCFINFLVRFISHSV